MLATLQITHSRFFIPFLFILVFKTKTTEGKITELLKTYVNNRGFTPEKSEELIGLLNSVDKSRMFETIFIAKDSSKNSVLHCAALIDDEITSNGILGSLYEEDVVKGLKLQNDFGQTPVFLAASRGHSSLIKSMLENVEDTETWHDILKVQDETGDMASHAAAHFNSGETLYQLLCHPRVNQEERLSMLSMGGKDGCTPLHIAAYNCYTSILENIKNTVDDDSWLQLMFIKDDSGYTPIGLAARKDPTTFVKMFLNDLDTNKVFDVVLKAASTGDVFSLEFILNSLTPEQRFKSFYLEDSPRKPVLHELFSTHSDHDTLDECVACIAAHLTDVQIYELLIKPDSQGTTVIQCAATTGKKKSIFSLLKPLSAQQQLQILRMECSGKSASDWARENGHEELANDLEEQMKGVRYFISYEFVSLDSRFSENKSSYKFMLFTTNLFVADLLKLLRSCQLTGKLFKTSVKRQLFKMVITFLLRTLQPVLMNVYCFYIALLYCCCSYRILN